MIRLKKTQDNDPSWSKSPEIKAAMKWLGDKMKNNAKSVESAHYLSATYQAAYDECVDDTLVLIDQIVNG